MARSANTIRTGTSTVFGPRNTGDTAGVFLTDGARNELVVEVTPSSITTGLLMPTYIPAGAAIIKAYIKVVEAFASTTLVLDLGTSGSEATNGFTIVTADGLNTAGTYKDLTAQLSGTWDNEVFLAALTRVNIVATSGTLGAVGRLTLVVEYIKAA